MTSQPKRIQRKRIKGWRMPAGAVYVGRPTKWGNPITIANRAATPIGAVLVFEYCLNVAEVLAITPEDVRRELRGKNLACWCPLNKPCHADVLLKVANA